MTIRNTCSGAVGVTHQLALLSVIHNESGQCTFWGSGKILGGSDLLITWGKSCSFIDRLTTQSNPEEHALGRALLFDVGRSRPTWDGPGEPSMQGHRQGLRLARENEMLVSNREGRLTEFLETVLTPRLPGLEANKHPFSLSQFEVVSLPFTT